jgi:RNA polymerase sigma-70 factor (ECF subfamily)
MRRGVVSVQDQAAFDAFYLSSRARLLRQLTAMTADPELAKDALQEAYERAWQRWGRVRGLDEPEAWVRTVAWRVAVSHHRRAAVAARFLPMLRRESTVAPVASDEVLDVQTALRTLPADQRRVLVLHHMAGRSVEDVAEEVGVAVGTVKSRLSRGRAALAAALGPAYSDRRVSATRTEDES